LDSPIGRVFIEYSSRGELVPDEPTVELWSRFIESSKQSGRFRPDKDTLVLDGIPRNVHQAQMLKDTLEVRAVFFLRCPNMNKLVERLQRRALRENRLDDANLDIIRSRLKTYERETKPVLKYYGKNITHKIDSTQTPVKVLCDILEPIKNL
jgi:adenylate kinase